MGVSDILFIVKKQQVKPNREKEAKRYLTVSQLSERWSISLAHGYRLLERSELPSLRIGAAVRVPLQAVEEYERRSADAA
jgi:excisionase family DNA binding protein